MTIAQASPNIALIKYWGKLPATGDEDRNLATNPSLSLTLSKAKTQSEFKFCDEPTKIIINKNVANDSDVEKVSAHVSRCLSDLGCHQKKNFFLETSNNFPTGAGIASSASAFAALSFAVCAEFLGPEGWEDFLSEKGLEKLSTLARRGSGSAARSVSGPWMFWDGSRAEKMQSNWNLYDTVLILSEEEKKVSSSEGHLRAASSPIFADRINQLPQRIAAVKTAIAAKDLQMLGPLVETEADELHHIVESSTPPLVYRSKQTLRVLEHIRNMTHRNFYYTIDAGPNIHILSETPVKEELQEVLERCQLPETRIWSDEAGTGAQILSF